MVKHSLSNVESRSSKASTGWLSISLAILFAVFLLLLSVFSILMPEVVGKTAASTIPLWWIVLLYIILASAASPTLLIVDDFGLHLQIWWWQTALSWYDIDKVVEYKNHTFVFSKKLPLISLLSGILLFRFRRLFSIHWRRENYKIVVDMMRANLGGRFETA